MQESDARRRAEGLAEDLKRAQGSAAELSKALAAQSAERCAAERCVKDAEVRLSAAVSARQRNDARYEARIQVRPQGGEDALVVRVQGWLCSQGCAEACRVEVGLSTAMSVPRRMPPCEASLNPDPCVPVWTCLTQCMIKLRMTWHRATCRN